MRTSSFSEHDSPFASHDESFEPVNIWKSSTPSWGSDPMELLMSKQNGADENELDEFIISRIPPTLINRTS